MNRKIFLAVSVLILVSLVVSACGPSQAAIEEAIAQTETARPTATATVTNTQAPTQIPTKTPTAIPSPTPTRGPTNTPNPNLIAKDFIYYFKDNYQFYAKKMTPPIEVELTRFEFVYDPSGKIILMLDTKSGLYPLKEGTPLYYSLAVLTNDLKDKPKLPENIDRIIFTFRDNDNEVYDQTQVAWDTLMDYVQNDISLDQLLVQFTKP